MFNKVQEEWVVTVREEWTVTHYGQAGDVRYIDIPVGEKAKAKIRKKGEIELIFDTLKDAVHGTKMRAYLKEEDLYKLTFDVQTNGTANPQRLQDSTSVDFSKSTQSRPLVATEPGPQEGGVVISIDIYE